MMKAPPLFMLNIPQRSQGVMRSAVLFPVLVRGKNVVLATAAHTVAGIIGPYEMILSDANGQKLPATKNPVKTMILPVGLGIDLAFLEMPMDSLPTPVKWSDQSIPKGAVLHHARNVLFRKEFEETCLVTEQTVSPLPRRFALSGGQYVEVFGRRGVIGGKVYKNLLRGLSMRSWPGVSGSPIWDTHGSVLGMVCGGNEELTDVEREFFLV